MEEFIAEQKRLLYTKDYMNAVIAEVRLSPGKYETGNGKCGLIG